MILSVLTKFYAFSNNELWANHFAQSNDPSDESVWEKGAYTFHAGDDGVSTLKIGETLEGIAQGSYVEATLSFTGEASGSFYAQGYEIEDGNQGRGQSNQRYWHFYHFRFRRSPFFLLKHLSLLANKKTHLWWTAHSCHG